MGDHVKNCDDIRIFVYTFWKVLKMHEIVGSVLYDARGSSETANFVFAVYSNSFQIDN